jgi:hypothetical protein
MPPSFKDPKESYASGSVELLDSSTTGGHNECIFQHQSSTQQQLSMQVMPEKHFADGTNTQEVREGSNAGVS